MSTAVASKGLEGIVATTSSICWIDGDAGVLSYRGIDIHELAEQIHLRRDHLPSLVRHLPTASELADFSKELAAARNIDPKVIDLLRMRPHQHHPHGGPPHRRLHAQHLRRRREATAATPPISANPSGSLRRFP